MSLRCKTVKLNDETLLNSFITSKQNTNSMIKTRKYFILLYVLDKKVLNLKNDKFTMSSLFPVLGLKDHLEPSFMIISWFMLRLWSLALVSNKYGVCNYLSSVISIFTARLNRCITFYSWNCRCVRRTNYFLSNSLRHNCFMIICCVMT